MTTPGTTTIRVNIETRSRLQELLAGKFKGMTADQLLQHWLNEQWKQDVIADFDRLREEDTGAWRQELAENDHWDRSSSDPTAEEGPYEGVEAA